MGRPPLALGTAGSVRYKKDGTTWTATCRFRDFDGTSKEVQRSGATKGKAETALRLAIRDRQQGSSSSSVKSDSKVSSLLRKWWSEKLLEGKLAPSSVANYQDILERILIPGIGELRLNEVTTGSLRSFLLKEGSVRLAQAELAQTLLRQAFRYALEHNAVPVNPALGIRLQDAPKPSPRALSREELGRMRLAVRSMRQNTWLADIIEVQLGVAGRIGEVLSLSIEDLELDSREGPLVLVRSTIVKIPGRHAYRQQHTKDGPEGSRLVRVPDFAAEVLARRASTASDNLDHLLFVSRNNTVLDPHNVRASWRGVRRRFDLDWIRPHHLRKTSATKISEVFDDRTASQFLDHKQQATTTTYYVQKAKESVPDVRAALNQLAPDSD